MTEEINSGDTVRVVYEGRVVDVDQLGFELDNGVSVTLVERAGKRVEILERAKPKVGDMLDSRARLADLPYNSVVTNKHGNPLIVKASYTVDQWGNVTYFELGTDNAPYTVRYIPK